MQTETTYGKGLSDVVAGQYITDVITAEGDATTAISYKKGDLLTRENNVFKKVTAIDEDIYAVCIEDIALDTTEGSVLCIIWGQVQAAGITADLTEAQIQNARDHGIFFQRKRI